MEITALLVEFGTLWCGLMIYESGPESEGMNAVMTTCGGSECWADGMVPFCNVRAYAEQTKNKENGAELPDEL